MQCQEGSYIAAFATSCHRFPDSTCLMSNFLQDGGVSNPLKSRGYGERQPIASNTTDDGRQQNRRVVLRVLN